MPIRPVPPERLPGPLAADQGLSAADITAQRARFGPNDIIESPRAGWREWLRDTARDPMIWFLAVTAALFAALADYREAIVLLLALLPIAGMDAWLHRRTRASTQALASRLATTAHAIRDGVRVDIPSVDLVPGDLVEIDSGEPFPADGLVVAGESLQTDESALTGEAWPVRKQPLPAHEGNLPASADTLHWTFAGTRLLTGRARMRVVATGGATLYGEIVRSANAGTQARTPLQDAIANLVAVMLVAALALCIALAAIRYAQGHGVIDALLSALTLAIAALPEEFPVVFAFFLGVGVYRLARRQALVQRAVAVENIGRVTCICSDKTGTLTEGKLKLAHPLPAEGMTEEQLVALASLAARNDSGDPLDEALLAAGRAATDDTPRATSVVATFPFTEDRRRETAIVQGDNGSRFAVMKGAPETVFARCVEDLSSWREQVQRYAASGHKVIACAACPLTTAATDQEPGSGFRLAGLLAFEDPLREGAQEAVANCRQAGIRVIMITGDHPLTAAAIARDIGLGGDAPVVLSAEDNNDIAALQHADVIARAAPAQKLQLVQALQAAGEIVAVTGDGVNDVPALKAADIGIAMGERGTQGAREVAAIVLLDDNFRTLVSAIAEGRQLFRNLQLSFAWLLLVHIPFVLTAALVPLAGYPLLYLPIHIVWLELLIHPTAMLVFQDLPGSERLAPAQRDGTARFFHRHEWRVIAGGGLALTAVVTSVYIYALGDPQHVEHARAMAISTLVVAATALTAVLSGLRTHMARGMVLFSLASLVLFVQVPSLAAWLHLAPLHAADWTLTLLAGLIAAGCGWLLRRN